METESFITQPAKDPYEKTGLDPLLKKTKPLSQKRGAKYKRDKALLDPEYLEKVKQYRKDRDNQKRVKKIRYSATIRHDIGSQNGYLEKRVAFHLSKGRDVADIVVRENALMSTVQAIIQKLSTK